MTDLTNLASRITDHSNAVHAGYQAIIATLREMDNADITVVCYDDGTERPLTLVVYPAGSEGDIDNSLCTVELPAGYRDDLDFAVSTKHRGCTPQQSGAYPRTEQESGMDLEVEALIVQRRANAALAVAHPRENTDTVIRDIVDGWEYVEANTVGGPRSIAITRRSR